MIIPVMFLAFLATMASNGGVETVTFGRKLVENGALNIAKAVPFHADADAFEANFAANNTDDSLPLTMTECEETDNLQLPVASTQVLVFFVCWFLWTFFKICFLDPFVMPTLMPLFDLVLKLCLAPFSIALTLVSKALKAIFWSLPKAVCSALWWFLVLALSPWKFFVKPCLVDPLVSKLKSYAPLVKKFSIDALCLAFGALIAFGIHTRIASPLSDWLIDNRIHQYALFALVLIPGVCSFSLQYTLAGLIYSMVGIIELILIIADVSGAYIADAFSSAQQIFSRVVLEVATVSIRVSFISAIIRGAFADAFTSTQDMVSQVDIDTVIVTVKLATLIISVLGFLYVARHPIKIIGGSFMLCYFFCLACLLVNHGFQCLLGLLLPIYGYLRHLIIQGTFADAFTATQEMVSQVDIGTVIVSVKLATLIILVLGFLYVARHPIKIIGGSFMLCYFFCLACLLVNHGFQCLLGLLLPMYGYLRHLIFEEATVAIVKAVDAFSEAVVQSTIPDLSLKRLIEYLPLDKPWFLMVCFALPLGLSFYLIYRSAQVDIARMPPPMKPSCNTRVKICRIQSITTQVPDFLSSPSRNLTASEANNIGALDTFLRKRFVPTVNDSSASKANILVKATTKTSDSDSPTEVKRTEEVSQAVGTTVEVKSDTASNANTSSNASTPVANKKKKRKLQKKRMKAKKLVKMQRQQQQVQQATSARARQQTLAVQVNAVQELIVVEPKQQQTQAVQVDEVQELIVVEPKQQQFQAGQVDEVQEHIVVNGQEASAVHIDPVQERPTVVCPPEEAAVKVDAVQAPTIVDTVQVDAVQEPAIVAIIIPEKNRPIVRNSDRRILLKRPRFIFSGNKRKRPSRNVGNHDSHVEFQRPQKRANFAVLVGVDKKNESAFLAVLPLQCLTVGNTINKKALLELLRLKNELRYLMEVYQIFIMRSTRLLEASDPVQEVTTQLQQQSGVTPPTASDEDPSRIYPRESLSENEVDSEEDTDFAFGSEDDDELVDALVEEIAYEDDNTTPTAVSEDDDGSIEAGDEVIVNEDDDGIPTLDSEDDEDTAENAPVQETNENDHSAPSSVSVEATDGTLLRPAPTLRRSRRIQARMELQREEAATRPSTPQSTRHSNRRAERPQSIRRSERIAKLPRVNYKA